PGVWRRRWSAAAHGAGLAGSSAPWCIRSPAPSGQWRTGWPWPEDYFEGHGSREGRLKPLLGVRERLVIVPLLRVQGTHRSESVPVHVGGDFPIESQRDAESDAVVSIGIHYMGVEIVGDLGEWPRAEFLRVQSPGVRAIAAFYADACAVRLYILG